MKRNSTFLKTNFKSGFTLIELSIVVMLVGLIFVGIFTSYSTALKITNETDSGGVGSKKDILYAIENVRSTLSRAFFNQTQRRLLFVGKGEGDSGSRFDRVVFCASIPNAEETGNVAVREVSFYLKKKSEADVFATLVRREDDMVDDQPVVGGNEHVLLENVKSFQLKYSERGDKWIDDWNSRNFKKIPRLIRIEIIALSGKQMVKYESLAFPGILFK